MSIAGDLKGLDSPQINPQICFQLLNMIFWAIIFYLMNKKSKNPIFSYRALCLKEVNIA